jgi:hypothetical protein
MLDAITTCFMVCTFNPCKTKAQQMKVKTWKRKHETAKWNYLTLFSCENAKKHRFVLGYLYYKYADKS